jgi:hypothetical protein
VSGSNFDDAASPPISHLLAALVGISFRTSDGRAHTEAFDSGLHTVKYVCHAAFSEPSTGLRSHHAFS